MDVLVAGILIFLWGIALTLAFGYMALAREQLENEEKRKHLTK